MYAKILVPVDGSDPSMCGLNEAIKLGKALGSQLRLLHIVNELIFDYPYSPNAYASTVIVWLRASSKIILDEAESLARLSGLQPERIHLESIGGAAAALIIAQAKEWRADLIVMGTHGRRGIRHLALGSDAEGVVRNTPVPILLLRGPSNRT